MYVYVIRLYGIFCEKGPDFYEQENAMSLEYANIVALTQQIKRHTKVEKKCSIRQNKKYKQFYKI